MKLFEAIDKLKNAGVDNPVYDAREIFRIIGKIHITELISRDAESLIPEVSSAVERRCRREPLQYIIGAVDFYRESYRVTPDCLIPRQETELLVDYAVKHLPDGCCFLDLCTGSGCIAISTLKNTKETRAYAVDISEGALDLARQNAEQNGVSDRIDFVKKDVLTDALKKNFFAVLSNPPYVTEDAYLKLEPEIYFEPKIAFVGKDSGLEFYKRILELYKDKTDPDGFFAFEIGYDQGDSLVEIAHAHGMTCEIIKDYSGNDRIAVIRAE